MRRRLGIVGTVIGIGAAFYLSLATDETGREGAPLKPGEVASGAPGKAGQPSTSAKEPPESRFEQRAAATPPPPAGQPRSASPPLNNKMRPSETAPGDTSAKAPPSPSSGSPRQMAEPQPAEPADGLSPKALASTIQSELRRAGCYAGEVNGAWTAATQRAMQAFVARMNASLPTDKPDFVLLSLLQTRGATGCKTCPPGQASGSDGNCAAASTSASLDNKTATGSRGQAANAAAEKAALERRRIEAEQKARAVEREQARAKAEQERLAALEARKRELIEAEEKRSRLKAQRDAEIAEARRTRLAAEAETRKAAEAQRRLEMAAVEAKRGAIAAARPAAAASSKAPAALPQPPAKSQPAAPRVAAAPLSGSLPANAASRTERPAGAAISTAPIARPAPVAGVAPIVRPEPQEIRSVAVIRLAPAPHERNALGGPPAPQPAGRAAASVSGRVEPTSAQQPRFVGLFVPPPATPVASPAPRARPAAVARPAARLSSVSVQRLTYREALYARLRNDAP